MSGFGRGHVRGLLAPWGEGFREHLLSRGYAWGSAAHQVHLMAHFSRWLEANGLTLAQIDRAAIAGFLAARRSDGYANLRSERAMVPLAGYLRDVGLVAPETPRLLTPAEVLLGDFERYLVDERGLADYTVRSYVGVARQFLAHDRDGRGLEDLSVGAVSDFVRDECARRGAASAKATVTGTRAWLRFLYTSGMTPALLAGAVPSAASWSLAGLPRGIGTTELASLLRSCDRRRAVGRRDFAILVLCSRLRVSRRRGDEVAARRHRLATRRTARPRQGITSQPVAAARRRRGGIGWLAYPGTAQEH